MSMMPTCTVAMGTASRTSARTSRALGTKVWSIGDEELAPHVPARVHAGDDGVHDARRAVDDVERRVEAVVRDLPRRDLGRILVGHPAGVHAVHVDAVLLVVSRGGARHHVERGLGHVRVRMPRGLEALVELPFHRRDVDDVLVAIRRAQHERLQARVQHERRDRVHELDLEQLHRGHLGEEQAPRVPAAQIDLLQVLVEASQREQIALRPQFLRQQRDLGPDSGSRW